MSSKEKEVSDLIFIILNLIIEQDIGPTYAARLLYLYTSMLRLGVKIIKPHTNLGGNYQFKENIINANCDFCDFSKYSKYYKYYKSFRNNYIGYIGIQSLKLIHRMYPKSEILKNFKNNNKISVVYNKTNKKFRQFLENRRLLQKINSELKSFYLNLDNDGWKESNKQLKLTNDYYINPDKVIDVEKLKNPLDWCLLENQKMLGSKWGNVKSLLSNKETRKLESYLDRKYKEIDVVKENKDVLKRSLQLTDENKISAELFQAIPGSVSPAGFWTMFLYRYFQANDRPNSIQLDFYYKLTCALFQASVTCWKIKYKYLQLRPIQCIRLNYSGDKFDYYFGDGVYGNMWKPFQEKRMMSPPFPDYISGHSTFSSAGAYILNKLIGSKIEDNIKISTDELKMLAPIFKNQPYQIYKLNKFFINPNTSLIQENVPSKKFSFKFSSWEDLALEAGMSRIYGGIHIDSANIEGFNAGKQIGSMILKKIKKKQN